MNVARVIESNAVPEEQPTVRFDSEMPDELQAGAYANLLNVWHTPYEFTLLGDPAGAASRGG